MFKAPDKFPWKARACCDRWEMGDDTPGVANSSDEELQAARIITDRRIKNKFFIFLILKGVKKLFLLT